MPKIGTSLSSKIKTWISHYPELKFDGKSVFCASCEKSVGCERKSQIDAHCNTENDASWATESSQLLQLTIIAVCLLQAVVPK